MGTHTSKTEHRKKMGQVYLRQNSKPDATMMLQSGVGTGESVRVVGPASERSSATNVQSAVVQVPEPINNGNYRKYGSEDRLASDSKGYGIKLTCGRICLWMCLFGISSVGIGVASCIGYMKYIAPNENEKLVDVTPPTIENQPIASAQRQTALQIGSVREAEKVIGRFTIEQERLRSHGQLRWQQSVDAPNTDIIPSQTDSCVKVPSAGTYCVVSQITFKFRSDDEFKAVGHSVVVKNNTDDEDLIQRKDVPVTIPTGHRGTIKEPSNLIVFPYVNAQDKICVNASPTSAIYLSPVSNMLTLFKL